MKKIFLTFGTNFANPLTAYLIVWGLTLFLYSIKFTNNILAINNKTIALIYSSCILFSFIYVSIKILNGSFVKKSHSTIYLLHLNNNEKILNKYKGVLRGIFIFWLILSLIEIILFKGIPLISVVILGQYDLDYKAFGVPTLHGLLNACYFTIVVGNFITYLIEKNRKRLYFTIILFIWPILLMSRAMILWGLIEILCVYLFFNRITVKNFFKIFFGIIIFIIIFGLIGDSRNGELKQFTTSTFVSTEYESVAEYIPSGFVWVYLYATTPINNIVINVNKLNPQFGFKYSLNGLIPSFIRDKIFSESDKYALILDDDAFNVSSYFANYLFDFGIAGAVIFAGFLQFITVISFFSAKSGRIGSLISYSVLYYAVFTSVFFDNFISLPTVFQIFIGLFINYYIYRKNKLHYV